VDRKRELAVAYYNVINLKSTKCYHDQSFLFLVLQCSFGLQFFSYMCPPQGLCILLCPINLGTRIPVKIPFSDLSLAALSPFHFFHVSLRALCGYVTTNSQLLFVPVNIFSLSWVLSKLHCITCRRTFEDIPICNSSIISTALIIQFVISKTGPQKTNSEHDDESQPMTFCTPARYSTN